MVRTARQEGTPRRHLEVVADETPAIARRTRNAERTRDREWKSIASALDHFGPLLNWDAPSRVTHFEADNTQYGRVIMPWRGDGTDTIGFSAKVDLGGQAVKIRQLRLMADAVRLGAEKVAGSAASQASQLGAELGRLPSGGAIMAVLASVAPLIARSDANATPELAPLADAASRGVKMVLGPRSSKAKLATELDRTAAALTRAADEAEVGAPPVKLFSNIHATGADQFLGDIDMKPVGHLQGDELAYRADGIAIPQVMNYRATVGMSDDGGKSWRVGGQALAEGYYPQIDDKQMKSHDVRFRPQPIQWEAINAIQMMVGQANAPFIGVDGIPGKHEARWPKIDWSKDPVPQVPVSTLDDLLDDGAYGIKHYAEMGANVMYIEDLLHLIPWEGRERHEMLGSPFATASYHMIDPRKTREGRKILRERPDDITALRQAGEKALARVVKAAERHGIKLMMGLAPNHTGHKYLQFDVVKKQRADGRVTLQLKRNYYDGLFASVERHINEMIKDPAEKQRMLDQLEDRRKFTAAALADKQREKTMQQVYPWMYSSADSNNLAGANSPSEIISDGDVVQPWKDIDKLLGAFASEEKFNLDSPWIPRQGGVARRSAGILGLEGHHDVPPRRGRPPARPLPRRDAEHRATDVGRGSRSPRAALLPD